MLFANPSVREIDEPDGAEQLVAAFVSGVLGYSGDPDIFLTAEERKRVFRLLSRADELAKEYRPGDRLVWTLEDLRPEDRARLAEPHLDRFVKALRARLPAGQSADKGPWPGGARFGLCLSHDMDHVTAFASREAWRQTGRARRAGWPPAKQVRLTGHAIRTTVGCLVRQHALRQPDPFGNVGDWLELEAECGFKSSLFFFAETLQPWHPNDCNYGLDDRIRFEGTLLTVRRLIREVSSRGWDVGLHGSIFSATELGVLKAQKKQLEAALGAPILTTRQHYLQFDVRRTPGLQSDAGLLADGTQGFNDTIGFRAGTSYPYRMWDWTRQALLPLWQVPLHIQDGPLLRQSKNADEAVRLCVDLMQKVESVGGCLGLLFHPASLATDLGFAVYREVLQEAKRRRAWAGSMREVAQSWQAHLEANVKPLRRIPDAKPVPWR
jgi:hypothetical protein